MYFAMELKHNPTGKDDIEVERERREEILGELAESVKESNMGDAGFSDEEDEQFDNAPSPELEALLPYYHQVEDEALNVAKKCFHGTFISDSRNVQKQKLFEYERNGHTYRCYVDIYNENENEINIIEVKATTNRKYLYWIKYKGDKKENQGLFFRNTNARDGRITYPLFVKKGNFWHLNTADTTVSDVAFETFTNKKAELLNRQSKVGKYPHDLAFQRFVIEHALRKAGDNRPVNYYLAVLNSEYIYDGAIDENGQCEDFYVFHSGTTMKDGKYYTNGGRVLGLTYVGEDLKSAQDHVYNNIDKISFEKSFYRKDIGGKRDGI